MVRGPGSLRRDRSLSAAESVFLSKDTLEVEALKGLLAEGHSCPRLAGSGHWGREKGRIDR